MNLGFYFHVPFARDADGTVRVPGPFGVTLLALAREAGHLTFFGHRDPDPAGNEDHPLPTDLVTTVDLGPLRSFPARTFNPRPALRAFDPSRVDAMLVQGASPLLPSILRASGSVPAFVMLGADYWSWEAQEHYPGWRNALIRLWTSLYGWQQHRATDGRVVFLQDPSLERGVPRASRREVVFVPALTRADAEVLDRVPARPPLDGRAARLLYTGRVVAEKGIFESVHAVSLLRGRGLDVDLDIVGWEERDSGVIDALRASARDLGVADHVHPLGYRSGQALLDSYAAADIFLVPTYWESFPRSAHEAMLAGLPVVTTNVGGMRHYVRDRETAMLVTPRSAEQVADAVHALIADDELRARVSTDGRAWAKQHTVEGGAARIVDLIRSETGDR